MPTADEGLNREQLALVVRDVQHLDAWKAVLGAVEAERERLVRRLVNGRLAPADYEGVAGEVRGLDLVAKTMTTQKPKARNPSQEDAA